MKDFSQKKIAESAKAECHKFGWSSKKGRQIHNILVYCKGTYEVEIVELSWKWF